MSPPHFFAGAPEPGEAVVLAPEDAGHAVRSLRIRPGDEFTSSDGRGALAVCRVTRAERLLVEGEVLERTVEPPPVPSLTVLMSPPKGDRLTWAVQKLAEVGVDNILLLQTSRSVRRWEGERAHRVAPRLEVVAREAAKQSRRRFLPTVAGPVPWTEAVVPPPGGPLMVLWEDAGERLRNVLPSRSPDEVALVVGPEGGIPEEEARAAEAAGALLASLGPDILRTETAAVVGATLVLAEYGRLG